MKKNIIGIRLTKKSQIPVATLEHIHRSNLGIRNTQRVSVDLDSQNTTELTQFLKEMLEDFLVV